MPVANKETNISVLNITEVSLMEPLLQISKQNAPYHFGLVLRNSKQWHHLYHIVPALNFQNCEIICVILIQ